MSGPRARLRAVLAVAAVAAALVVLFPAPAFAHASLVSTDPASGQVVKSPPKAITLRFNESVQILPSAIRVYDSRGNAVDTGEAEHPDGKSDEVRSSVPRLKNGTYVVTWRVVSSDAHPVRASFVFTVGSGVPPSQLDTLVNRLLDEQGGSTATGVAYGITRGVVFGGLTLLVGGAAFLVMMWPGGRDSKRARAIVWFAWGVTAVFTLAAIGLEGAYTDARPLGDALKPSVVGDVLDTRYGRMMLLRLVLLLLAIPLLRLLLPRRRPAAEYPLPRWWAPVAAVLGIGLLLTPGLSGHASTGRWVALALPTDVVHLGAVALWLGGLVVLALAVLPRSPVEELRDVLPRYSRQAFCCVVLIIVSGALQAWRQVGSLSQLRDTDYGRILVVKLLVFGGLIIIAAFSREIVNRTFRAPREAQPTTEARVLAGAGGPPVDEPPDDPGGASDSYADPIEYDEYDYDEEYDEESERLRLRWSVLLEVVVAIGILSVTALLVNAAPARTAPVDGIAQVTLKSSAVWVDVDATPGRAGTNELHVTALDPNGTLTSVEDLTMRASLSSRNVAPIDIELRQLGPGHYVANALTFPFPGKWRLEAQVTVSGNQVEALAGNLDIG